MTHPEIEARSLAMHRLVAAKVRQDPSLLETARATLARWRSSSDANRSERYLAEWARVLEGGLEPTLALLVEESEHAVALRQCSPFPRALSTAERYAFLKEWRREHEAR